ncbi:MAG: hypothetical protein R3293_11525 [Candidatus Promineifilaceae bacterium]|nr:hypothetical protein [Candidatus Promineifilaceae bacterium]
MGEFPGKFNRRGLPAVGRQGCRRYEVFRLRRIVRIIRAKYFACQPWAGKDAGATRDYSG